MVKKPYFRVYLRPEELEYFCDDVSEVDGQDIAGEEPEDCADDIVTDFYLRDAHKEIEHIKRHDRGDPQDSDCPYAVSFELVVVFS